MTAKLKKVPVFGEGIYSRSAVVTRQRRLNCYLETRSDGDRSSIVAYGTPGLSLLFNASTPYNYPARAMIGNDNALYLVAGTQVTSLSRSGAILGSATIGSNYGPVALALNPTQMLIADGVTGYVFNTATYALTTSPSGFPNGARTATYCNGFFICELPGTNQFFVSTLNDGTSWPGLSYAAAVQSVDGIEATDTLGGVLIIFSSGHTEFWQNQGLNPEPFVYIQGSATSFGIEAIYSRAHVGDSLVFLAHGNGGSLQNSAGSFHVCQIQGYTVTIVSSNDVDNIIQQMARTSSVQDATAFSYEIDGHVFYQINFPTANRSLLWDSTAGPKAGWSEIQSGVTSGYAARHLGNFGANAYDLQLVSDYSNGNIYQIDPTVYTDNGNTIVRELVTRCVLNDFNAFQVGAAYFDMQTGVGLPLPSQQGYNPMVSIERAVDNRDFGPSRLFALGKQGQYITRVAFRRNGRSDGQGMTFRLRMTEPVPFVVTGGALNVASGVR